MSVNKETFLIIGCDIKDCLTEKFEDWYWSKDGEKYHDYQRKGNIQIIDDGMSGQYTYFGYIVANFEDDYGKHCEEIDFKNIDEMSVEVEIELQKLINRGIVDKEKCKDLKTKVILFDHYR